MIFYQNLQFWSFLKVYIRLQRKGKSMYRSGTEANSSPLKQKREITKITNI